MQHPAHLPGEGDRRASGPARAPAHAQRPRPGDVVMVTRIDRLAHCTFDLFGIVKRIVDAKAQFRSTRGTVGRHRSQHRTLDARGLGRTSGRRARSNPHPYRRWQKPRQGSGKAYGSAPSLTLAQQKEANRRHAQGATLARIGTQLQCRYRLFAATRALPNLCLAPAQQSSRPTFPSEQC